MAGSKKNKSKKSSTRTSPELEPEVMTGEDDELMNDLMAQLDSRDQTVQMESANVLNEMQLNKTASSIQTSHKQDAKSRHRARQARKAAALAQSYSPDDPETQARLEKEARDERFAIENICEKLNLQIYEINPDGHCLFSAIADQLEYQGVLPPSKTNYALLRSQAAAYIQSHPDDFIPFLPSTDGEDGTGALDAGLMTPDQLNQYCAAIRDTAIWGGEPEILALSRAYMVPIHVVQGGVPPIVTHQPGNEIPTNTEVKISYHRKLFGLGEHYNSLRPKSIV